VIEAMFWAGVLGLVGGWVTKSIIGALTQRSVRKIQAGRSAAEWAEIDSSMKGARLEHEYDMRCEVRRTQY